MEACDRLSLTSIEPRDVLASASEEDGLIDILQRHLLLEPLYGQLAIRGRVPTTDTGPAQQHLLEGLNEQSLSRSIRIQSVRLGRPLIRPVVASDLKGPSGMLVGAQRDLAELFFFEFSQILADRATGLVQSLRQLALTKDEASRAPFGSQRDVNEELEGSIGEFVRGGLPTPVGSKPTLAPLDFQ